MNRNRLLWNRLLNKPLPWHENKHYMEIYNLLSANGNWFNDKGEEWNEAARQALIETLVICRKLKADKFYEAYGPCGHVSYLQSLFKIRRALAEGLYMRACNELLDVVYLQPFTQARILNNVIALLSEYF